MSSISTACDAMVIPNRAIGVSDAFGEIDICTTHGTPSRKDLRGIRGAVSGQPQDPELHLPEPISVHDLCATDVWRELAGHRTVFAFASREALPHGYPLGANVTWNTCLLEFTVQGSITHGSSTGFFDEPRSVDFESGHPVRSP